VSFKTKSYIPLKKVWIKREWNTILIWSLVVVFAESYDDISSYGIKDFAKESVILLLIVFYFTAFAFLFREE